MRDDAHMWILIIGWVLKSSGYSKHVAETQNGGYLNSGYSKKWVHTK